MREPSQPVRVIYAKLTSSGAYDVVARTSNIELTPARTLAERLVPGNVPHGVTFDHELAYLRPSEGGHLVVRYAPYGWREERGEVYLTDVVWLSDVDFQRARCNAFAVAPPAAGVYETRVDLPPLEIAPRSEEDDFARLAELLSAPGDVSRLMAGVLAASPVLAIEAGDRLRLLELFTLLLPPSLRPLLTFHSRAFRVPHYPPRVTLADRMHGTLEGGPWAAVLPDASLNVPQTLADELVSAARDLAAFRQAHGLYERDATSPKDLKAELLRLLSYYRFAKALAGGDWTEALRLSSKDRALVAAVLEQAPREAALDAIVARGAPDAAVLQWLAEQDDADGALRLLDTSPIEIAGTIGAVADTRTGAFLRACAAAVARGRGLDSATALLRAAAPLAPALPGDGTRRLVHVLRELVRHAISTVRATPEQLQALLELQHEGESLLAGAPALAAALPPLFAEGPVALSDDLRVLGTASLVLRTRAGGSAEHVAGAAKLLADAPKEQREAVRRLLADVGVRDDELLALPGGEGLLQLFGASAQRTALLRDLVRSASELNGDEGAIGRLAVAVVRARAAHVVLDAGAPAAAEIAAALARGVDSDAVLEAALDLLAEVCSRDAFDAIERAALERRAQPVRLRRLDRALATIESAEDERTYEQLAAALEQGGAGIDPALRKRLRRTLGTGGLGRRMARLFGEVMEQNPS